MNVGPQRPATVAASFVALFSPSKQVLLYT